MAGKKRGRKSSGSSKKGSALKTRKFLPVSNRFIVTSSHPANTKKVAGYVDYAFATIAASSGAGSVALLATIAQGPAVTQRLGKKARYKSVQLRGNVRADTGTATTKVAVLVVYDRAPRGAVPAITDIFNTDSSNSFNNDAMSDRYRIIHRRDYNIVGTSAGTTSASQQVIEEYIPLNLLPVNFAALGTGAITDIVNGALYLVVLGDVGAGTTDATVNIGARIRFVDVEG